MSRIIQQAEFKFGRRELLAGMAAGSFGVAAGSVLGQDERREECYALIKVSKVLVAEIRQFNCLACGCEVDNVKTGVSKIDLQYSGKLTNNKECDETIERIPEGTRMSGSLKIQLRNAKCPKEGVPVLIGQHTGDFRLVDPKKRTLFVGTLAGTNGFEPDAKAAGRCCSTHGHGLADGQAVDLFRGCGLRLSYQLDIPLDAKAKPCEGDKPKEFKLNLDGVMMCVCT